MKVSAIANDVVFFLILKEWLRLPSDIHVVRDNSMPRKQEPVPLIPVSHSIIQ